MDIRPAEQGDIDPLAQLWLDGWRDAHLGLVPADLIRLRTLESFRDRLQAGLPSLRVVGPTGAPIAFHFCKDDEVYQFFVAAPARGTGLAARLMADAEATLAAAGYQTAWLACVIGNHRAARFYETAGWRRTGVEAIAVETSQGPYAFEIWRYEKPLA